MNVCIMFFSRHKGFDKGVIGKAIVGSMCSYQLSGAVISVCIIVSDNYLCSITMFPEGLGSLRVYIGLRDWHAGLY